MCDKDTSLGGKKDFTSLGVAHHLRVPGLKIDLEDWRDSSMDKMPATQAWGTKFKSRAPMRKLDVVVLIYNPNLVWEADRYFSEFADYQLGQSLKFGFSERPCLKR